MKKNLDSRAAMLETLKMAYRYMLDISQFELIHGVGKKRLNATKQRELGRRLAEYWSMKT